MNAIDEYDGFEDDGFDDEDDEDEGYGMMDFDLDFLVWVTKRHAHDNPRGDFIRDTREAMDWYANGSIDTSQFESMLHNGCDEACKQYHLLREEYESRK